VSARSLPAASRETLSLLRVEPDAAPREAELYVRYVRALALLSECAPFVDDPDYAELIGAVLVDAQANYPLLVRRDGGRWQIGPAV